MTFKLINWFKWPTSSSLEVFFMLVATAFLLLNQWHMVVIHQLLPAPAQAQAVGEQPNAVAAGLLPHGVPERYGAELGISFDDAARAMPVLENFDRGSGAITLKGQLQQRYISIGSQTACEFCCGAKTLVFTDGKPACGCAHSAAMRGLALYLLQKYPEMSDSQILAEVNRWKAAFFPRATVERATGQTAPSNSLPGQVGGC